MSNVTQTSSPYFYVSRKRYQRYPSPIPQPQLPAPTGNFTLIRDVEYGRGGDGSLKLDIYIPETPLALPMPAVIFIHGGGWEGGDKYPGQITSLVRRNFFGVSINYRLSGVAPFPAAIEDCKCAETKLLGGTMELAESGQAVCITPFTLAGAMAPITANDFLLQRLKEIRLA